MSFGPSVVVSETDPGHFEDKLDGFLVLSVMRGQQGTFLRWFEKIDDAERLVTDLTNPHNRQADCAFVMPFTFGRVLVQKPINLFQVSG